MEIVFLIISHSNYFMEFQNQKKSDEFLTLNKFKIHDTEFIDVGAQLVTINRKVYVGVERKTYF